MQDIKFEQIPLFDGGHQELTVELTLHLHGSRDQVEVGYSIRNTLCGTDVELGTLGVIGRRQALAGCAMVLEQLIRQAEKHLDPF